MSSCAASCCIYSPRALFAFATSASWPTADAPRYCHYASQRLAQFHRRSNYKPSPPRNRTLFGVAPSVADRWRSSNDLPLLNSNFVLHQCWSLMPHESARPQLENSARFTVRRPRPPAPDPIPPASSVTPFSAIDSRPHALVHRLLHFCADSRQLQHLSLAPFNLHKARVRRASGFLLTAFSNARPNLRFRSTLLTKGAPPKKH